MGRTRDGTAAKRDADAKFPCVHRRCFAVMGVVAEKIAGQRMCSAHDRRWRTRSRAYCRGAKS
jgi:hypothetical protein